MGISRNELKFYENFEQMANDVIALAKTFLPDKMIYINYLNDKEQVTLKVSEHQTKVNIYEGMTIQVTDGLCDMVDFIRNKPLIYENIEQEKELDSFKSLLKGANINAYMGIPILLDSGERFGTLCSAHDEATHFDEYSIQMLQKIAHMFSYYLKLEHLAYKDALTGLYNRQYLYQHFEALSQTGAIFYFDLDSFKKVNDTFGHDRGDLILKEMAHKLQTFFKPYDAFSVRLGGDEFVTVLTLTDEIVIEEMATACLELFENWETPQGDIKLSASMGITYFNKQEQNAFKVLLKEADMALYEAKAKGKHTFHIYQK